MNEDRILILDLLDILKRYSNKENPLTQKNIIEILENENGKYKYGKVRRQTIQTNLEKLLIHYESENREIRLLAEDDYYDMDIDEDDEMKRRITNIYHNQDLTDSELLLLIDSILFSKQIAKEERKELIKKLEKLASRHFKSRMGNISSISSSNNKGIDRKNMELFANIKEVNQAINQSKKVSFNYLTYKIKGNKISLESRKDSQGEERKYIINPYHMAASNGRYYLICNNQSFEDISSYRLDRMIDIKILDSKRKPMRDVKGLGNNFNLNDYMAENIYMFGGQAEYIKLNINKSFLNDFTDWFYIEDITVQEEREDQIIVRVKSNRESMRRWALRYSLYAQVLAPKDLVDEIKEDLQNAMENYRK